MLGLLLPGSLRVEHCIRGMLAYSQALMGGGAQGRQPSMQQIQELRAMLLQKEDLRQPMDLQAQFTSANGMSDDANRSLMVMLQVSRIPCQR